MLLTPMCEKYNQNSVNIFKSVSISCTQKCQISLPNIDQKLDTLPIDIVSTVLHDEK